MPCVILTLRNVIYTQCTAMGTNAALVNKLRYCHITIEFYLVQE